MNPIVRLIFSLSWWLLIYFALGCVAYCGMVFLFLCFIPLPRIWVDWNER